MNKETIMKIFKEETGKFVKKENTVELKMKLLQTTEKFARTFDYELPKAYAVNQKLKKLIKIIIRKLTRFITKPYAEKMLQFQESICELMGMYIAKYDDIYQKLDRMDRQQNYFENQLQQLKKETMNE